MNSLMKGILCSFAGVSGAFGAFGILGPLI